MDTSCKICKYIYKHSCPSKDEQLQENINELLNDALNEMKEIGFTDEEFLHTLKIYIQDHS